MWMESDISWHHDIYLVTKIQILVSKKKCTKLLKAGSVAMEVTQIDRHQACAISVSVNHRYFWTIVATIYSTFFYVSNKKYLLP